MMVPEVQNPIVDLIIVGSGPAAMAAAIEARSHRLSVVVIDENSAPGGQIYRNVGESPVEDRLVLGKDYFYGANIVSALLASRATLLYETTVWLIQRAEDSSSFSIGIMRDGVAEIYTSKTVIIATGALERPFPIRGWTLPGVMTAGAAQTMLKASGAVPTGRLVLAGTGPLLYLLAAQFARASVPVSAILDTTPRSNWLIAGPYLAGFLGSSYFLKGLSLLSEVRRSTRIIRRVTSIEIDGEEHARSVSYTVKGRQHRIDADTVLLHQGIVPQVNLAMAAGCNHVWNEDRLAFEPVLDESFRSSIPGLSVAGDSGGILGALAAEISGRIAALQIAADLGRVDADKAGAGLYGFGRKLARVLRGRKFIDRLYRPADHFRVPGDDVVVCRCEEVTAGAVRAAAHRGAQGPNQTKTFLRTGMGPCQGRLCGLTVTEILAHETHKSPGEVGHLRIRNPVKPITLEALTQLKGDGETTRLF